MLLAHKIELYPTVEQADYLSRACGSRRHCFNQMLEYFTQDGIKWSKKTANKVYKAKLRGNEIIVADRFFPSSKTCSDCGNKKAKLSLSERDYTCEHRGLAIDRDLNAALNLKQYGEETFRPTSKRTQELRKTLEPQSNSDDSVNDVTVLTSVGNSISDERNTLTHG